MDQAGIPHYKMMRDLKKKRASGSDIAGGDLESIDQMVLVKHLYKTYSNNLVHRPGIQGWDLQKTMPGNVGSALRCSGGVEVGVHGTGDIVTQHHEQLGNPVRVWMLPLWSPQQLNQI